MTTLNSTGDIGRYSATGGYLSQAGNWTIDSYCPKDGAYHLNHSFDATIGASTSHDNMDMSADMNMQMQDHEGGTTSTNSNAQEDELESPPPPPAFDSFAWLAIGLSVAVGVGSAYYFKKSSEQLKNTLKTLEG